MTRPEPIRVVIADDHPMFREGLRFILTQTSDVVVVGEAADGDTAVALARDLCPDVMLMDLRMPGSDGLGATRRLAAEGGSPPVLVLTMYEDDENLLAALEAGARGYLVKGAGPEQVLSAVRALADGHAVFGAVVAGRMLTSFRTPAPPCDDEFGRLTVREREVLSHLSEGLTNQQIADRLVLSPVTVRNHVSNILTKLQVANRREAMLRALAQRGPVRGPVRDQPRRSTSPQPPSTA